MFKRVLSGVILAVAAISIMFTGAIWRLLAVTALMLLADYEILEAMRSRGLSPRAWPTYVFIITLAPMVYFGHEEFFWVSLIFTVVAVFCECIFTKNLELPNALASLIPIIYPLSFLQFLLTSVMLEADYLRWSVLLLGIGVPCLSDTFALFGGITLGKHKLAPRISPKKTWEGAVFGLIGGITAGALAWLLQPSWNAAFPFWSYMLYGAIGSIAGQIGDLAASLIKRETGIKDFGNLIPGHGGILDRLDSIMFALPFAAVLFTFLR